VILDVPYTAGGEPIVGVCLRRVRGEGVGRHDVRARGTVGRLVVSGTQAIINNVGETVMHLQNYNLCFFIYSF